MGQVRPRAAVISTVGALGVAASAYFEWTTNGGAADAVPLQRLLFASEVPSSPEYWQSMAAPLVVVGGIGVLGTLLLSRVVLLISFLLGVATAGLWVATEVLESSDGFSIDSVRLGGWVLLGALLVLLIGLIALRNGQDDEEDEDDITPFSPTPRSHSSFLDDDEGTTRIGPRPGPGPTPSEGPGAGSPSPFTPNDAPTAPQSTPPPAPRDHRPVDPF